MIKFLDKIASDFSHSVAKMLVAVKIKPMTVTVTRFLIAAPLSIYFFSQGEYFANIFGLLSYMALAILDWVDGEMAELYKLPRRTAPFGRLIDHTSDRILMLIVLGSIMYGGIQGNHSYLWSITTILYYSFFFMLTVTLYEFDKKFKIDFEKYPGIGQDMKKIDKNTSVLDSILFNLLYVHNNSLTRICFTHNYLLIIGIITNQLLACFIFITSMHALRSFGLFVIEYETLKKGTTKSTLAQVLRKKITF